MPSTPHIQQDTPLFSFKVICTVIVLVVVGVFLLLQLADFNRKQGVNQEYESLSKEYLFPKFSSEYREYWGIDDFDDYKTALKQQFEIERFQALEESYGENEEELLHFMRLRMISWLDYQIIERAECQLQFNRRGDKATGPYPIDLDPLSEAHFKQKVPY